MVVIVGQVQRRFRGREAFQEVDQVQSFGRLAKWATEVTDRNAVANASRTCCDICARAGRGRSSSRSRRTSSTSPCRRRRRRRCAAGLVDLDPSRRPVGAPSARRRAGGR